MIVGLGSNIAPRENIEKAVSVMSGKFSELACSAFVETAPLGFQNQAHFYNGAVRFKTQLSQGALKSWLRGVEADFGRVRTENKNGPRTLDLDILVWNGKIVDEDVPARAFLQEAIEALWPGLIESEAKK